MARFGQAGQALKPSKAPQQLSQAFEPQNHPQQLSKASRLLGHGSFLGPTCCFYWASKLVARFGQPLKPPKTPQQLSKKLEPQNPPQQLSKASRLLCHGTSLGPTSVSIGLRNCYVARFGHPLKPPKAPQYFSKALEVQNPPWYVPRPHKLFLLGFEAATWHVLGTPLKNPQKPRSSFRRP